MQHSNLVLAAAFALLCVLCLLTPAAFAGTTYKYLALERYEQVNCSENGVPFSDNKGQRD